MRGLRSSVVYTATQGEAVRASTEVVANHNHCHALTIQYFEVLRHLKLSQELADVQECLFVPLPMKEFDLPKATRWRESLQPYLRRPELSPAFDAARRVETDWSEVDFPAGRYGDESITAVMGELELTIFIPLPPIPPKPPEPPPLDQVQEALSPTSGFLGVLLAVTTLGASVATAEITRSVTQGARAVADSLYNEVGPEAQYERFQRDVMPGVAVGFVDELQLWSRQGNNEVRLSGVDFTLVSDYRPGQPLLVSVRGRVDNQPKRSEVSQLIIKSAVGLPPGCRVILNTASLRYQTSSFEHPFVTDWRVNDDIELPAAMLETIDGMLKVTFGDVKDARGATLYTPIDVWEQKNPRKEDQRLAAELVDHLNDGLEYYHNAIWWTMDPNRRYMLLDGFLAPRSAGRSVASVVENRLIGIAGNSLVMPVARGVHLDPRFRPKKEGEAFDLTTFYAPSTPIPPARISLPTRGVFAEAVMGQCNACEQMDDTRFWRWEEAPLDELPIYPSTETRRTDLSGTTTPSTLPSPVVAIQNAPAAPDPTGLAQLIELLGQQTFPDITGLAANQQNAAAAYQQALETAAEFGKEASKLTQQAAMLKSLDKSMAAIDKAEVDKKIKPEEAAKLRNSALEKVVGGMEGLKPGDVNERLDVIKKAVADGAVDATVGRGLSQAVLRSYVDGAEPPAKRAAAKLIDGIPPKSVTSVETAETRIQTAADRVEAGADVVSTGERVINEASAAPATAVTAGPETASVDSFGMTALTGPTPGLFVRSTAAFPDPILLSFRGRVQIGSAVTNAPDPADLSVKVRFRVADNLGLSGIVEQTQPVEADGSWLVKATLIPTGGSPPPDRLVGSITVEGSQAPVSISPVLIENARLEWMLDLFDREERRLALADPLAFLARVRKVLQPSDNFDFAIGRAVSEPPLFPKTSAASVRLQKAKTVWDGQEFVRMGHVIIAIEAGKNPEPQIPARLLGLVNRFTDNLGNIVTWSGDLGGALRTFLFQKYFPAIANEAAAHPSLAGYINDTASHEQLVGDIDGVVLSARYDTSETLAANLGAYYGADSRQRYSAYLAAQTDEAGNQALDVEPGTATITAASRQYIAETLSFSAQILLTIMLLLHRAPLNTPYPQEVIDALDVDSPEIALITRRFVDFLERGLAAEE